MAKITRTAAKDDGAVATVAQAPPAEAKQAMPTDPQLLDYAARAKRAQAQRKLAPLTGVVSRVQIPMVEIVDRLSASTGGQNGEYHWFWGLQDQSSFYADHGYEPVVESNEQVRYQGTPLWKIPTEFYHAELAAVSARDKAQMRTKVAQDKKDSVRRKTTPEPEEITVTRDGKDLLAE